MYYTCVYCIYCVYCMYCECTVCTVSALSTYMMKLHTPTSLCLILYSWSVSENLLHLVRCATSSGLIRWKTSALKSLRRELLPQPSEGMLLLLQVGVAREMFHANIVGDCQCPCFSPATTPAVSFSKEITYYQ